MTYSTELYHFGIKGQRWGVRRFQNSDGTLTADGRKRYKAYKKDYKEYNKLNRHVSAAQKHLKEEGVMLDRVRDKYLKENKNYQKEMRKSSGLFGLKGAEKADKVAKAQVELEKKAKDYETAAGNYGVAKKITNEDTRALKKHVDGMIRAYGKGSINELQTKTVKMGQNKLQKMLQGAPKSIIFNKGRETEEFIKTGKTLADMPLIGNLYTANYIGNRELDLQRSRIEKSENKATRNFKNNPEYLKDDSFKGVSSYKTPNPGKVAVAGAGKVAKGAANAAKKVSKKFGGKPLANPYVDKTKSDIDAARKQANDSKKAYANDKKQAKDAAKQQKAYEDRIAKIAYDNAKKASKQSSKPKSSVKSKALGAALTVAGAGLAGAAGPLGAFAAKQGIKAYTKRKTKKKIQSWFGHSATYNIRYKDTMTNRTDELYHYGVLGMRWGVRKNKYGEYSSKAAASQMKADAAKTKFGKHVHGDRAKDFKYMAETSKAMSKSTGLKGRIKAKYGFEANQRYGETQASKLDVRAKDSKLKINRAAASANAYNIRSAAASMKKVHNEKTFNNKVKKLLTESLRDRPIETIGGRHITSGKRLVDTIIMNVGDSIVPPVGSAYGLYQEFKGYSKNRH